MSHLAFFCCYIYVGGSGSITSVGEERANLHFILFRVSSKPFILYSSFD